MIKITVSQPDQDFPMESPETRTLIVDCLKALGWNSNPWVNTVYDQPIGFHILR